MKAVQDADAVTLLRIQLERPNESLFPSLREYADTYGMNENMFLWDLTTGTKITTATQVNYWGLAVAPDGTIATAGAGGVQIFSVDANGFKVIKAFKR